MLAVDETSFTPKAPEHANRDYEQIAQEIPYGSGFNYDFHVTLDESVAAGEYNYRTTAEHEQAGTSYYVDGKQPIEMPRSSYFCATATPSFTPTRRTPAAPR